MHENGDARATGGLLRIRRLNMGAALLAVALLAVLAVTSPASAQHELPGTKVISTFVPVAGGTDRCRAGAETSQESADRPGACLRTQIAVPVPKDEKNAQFPTLLAYHGYTHFLGSLDKPENLADRDAFRIWARDNGYAVMVLSIRGTGCSSGRWDFMAQQEALDARDAIAWIRAQQWSNGKVAMIGQSYTGWSQLGVAALAPEGLVAIAPAKPMTDPYRDMGYLGGIPNRGTPAGLTAVIRGEHDSASQASPDLPPSERDVACEAHQLDHADMTGSPTGVLTRHRYDDDELRQRSPHFSTIPLPTLTLVAWQDDQLSSRAIDSLSQVVTGPLHAVVTNGGHVGDYWSDRFQEQLRAFLDFYVKRVQNGYGERDRIQVWWETTRSPCTDGLLPTQCPNDEAPRWLTRLPSYPAPATRAREFYLSAAGTLDDAPGTGDPDSYDYVPGTGQRRGNEAFPFTDPTVRVHAGEPARTGPTGTTWTAPAPAGLRLAYTSPSLDKDLVALGAASLDLWLESSASDTDVQVVLTEVRPDGQEVYVQAGWLRASRRTEDPARTTPTRPFHVHRADVPLTPGVATLMRVEVWPFGHVFRKGSKLRVWIEAPARQYGARTLEPLPTLATNRVHHAGEHASVLRLSTLPGHAAPVELPECGTVVHELCRPDPLAPPAADMPGV